MQKTPLLLRLGCRNLSWRIYQKAPVNDNQGKNSIFFVYGVGIFAYGTANDAIDNNKE